MASKGFTVEDHNKFQAFIAETQAALKVSLQVVEENLNTFINASTCPVSHDCDTGLTMKETATNIVEKMKENTVLLAKAEEEGMELGIDFKKAYEAFAAQLAENSKKIADTLALGN